MHPLLRNMKSLEDLVYGEVFENQDNQFNWELGHSISAKIELPDDQRMHALKLIDGDGTNKIVDPGQSECLNFRRFEIDDIRCALEFWRFNSFIGFRQNITSGRGSALHLVFFYLAFFFVTKLKDMTYICSADIEEG